MSDPLTPATVNEQLDAGGWHDLARGPGCYAVRVETPPDDPRVIFERWTSYHDAAPQWLVDGLADADRLAYIGASNDIHARLLDHAQGGVRQTALLRVFSPVEVLGVKGTTTPFTAEYSYAKEWVADGFTVYADGQLHGL